MSGEHIVSGSLKTPGLYIHIPFCVRKCNYCDFLSFASGRVEDSPERMEYIRLLGEELRLHSKKKRAARNDELFDTIFIGGGTPSILSERELDLLFEKIADFTGTLPAETEYTMECNPGTVTPEKMKIMRQAGLNRISFGMQSAINSELAALGRIHTFEEFLESYKMAEKAGFDNINIDLMSAIPGQTLKSYEESLRQVISLEPAHISSYSLIIEEGTPFYEKYHENSPVDEDTDREMYEKTRELLEQAGYARYEISNYARKGRECRHNIKYWIRDPYLGVGLGAASLYDHARHYNLRDTSGYRKCIRDGKLPESEMEALDRKEEMAEFMFLGLRMMCGISISAFRSEFGTDLQTVYGDVIDRHIREGLLKKEGDCLALSLRGIDVSNYVFSDFV